MDSLLLIGREEALLRRLKGQLIRRGFHVTTTEFSDLKSLDGLKDRFVLGVLDASDSSRVEEVMGQVRKEPSCRALPFICLIKEAQAKELVSLDSVEDFLPVPVDPDMLEARLRFVLGRLNHSVPGTGIRIGALSLDVDRYEVSLDKEPLELTYKEFELLKFLATHPGRVFSRDQLLNQVWGYDFIGGTRTVDVHIRRLRAKLGPKYAALIATVRNVGYKFLESL